MTSHRAFKSRAAWLAGSALLLALALAGANCLTHSLGGAFSRRPHEIHALSPRAQDLVTTALAELQDGLVDHHVHIAGLGAGDTGVQVNPAMRSWWSPLRRMKFGIYMSASGVENEANADQRYVERLLELTRHMGVGGRYHILALDKHYRPDGTEDLLHTELYVPNEHVFRISAAHPDVFVPVISVHPYRPDALAELERWALAGGRMVKWLPNAMGIDPADPRCDSFYDLMRKHNLVLLTHTGEEQAVPAGFQELGNPLRLRRPLDRGVKVIAAHAASLGQSADLDRPSEGRATSFALFMRLMEEPRYNGLLFADISAMTQINRVGPPLAALLQRQDIHPRLVHGSDYPLPAINVLFSTGELEDQGYLNAREAKALAEIYDVNPLLFDLVLKRTIHDPRKGHRFAASVFTASPVAMK